MADAGVEGVAEEGHALGAGPNSRAYDLVAEDKVRSARDGNRVVFRPEWLDAYLLS